MSETSVYLLKSIFFVLTFSILCRLLTVEEKERLQKEDKLNKADKNIALAMEELNNYK